MGVSLSGGKSKIIDGYFGGFAHMFATRSKIRFPYAWHSTVVDLRTMKILASGQVSPSAAIAKCKSLPDDQ